MQSKLYKGQRHNVNQISKELGLDKMYLYRYVGNHERIKKIPYNIILGIAKIENIEVNKLYNEMLVYSLQIPNKNVK